MMMLFGCFEEEMAFFVQWVGGENKLKLYGKKESGGWKIFSFVICWNGK